MHHADGFALKCFAKRLHVDFERVDQGDAVRGRELHQSQMG